MKRQVIQMRQGGGLLAIAVLIIIVEAVSVAASPATDNLVLLDVEAQEKQQNKEGVDKEDMVDQDIMEYSALHAEQNVDDNVFENGGAILDALAENDPQFKNVALPTSKKSTKSKKATVKAVPKILKKVAPKKVVKKKQVEMIEAADSTSEDKVALPFGITQSDIFGTSSSGGDSSSSTSASDSETTRQTQQLSEAPSSLVLSQAATTSNAVQESDKQNFMDNILQSTIQKNTGLVAGLEGKAKRKLNSYEQSILEQNALWAEVAKQGGLQTLGQSEQAVKEQQAAAAIAEEQAVKSKQQVAEDSVATEALPKDSEKQEILSAVAALPADSVTELTNEIQKQEEQKQQEQQIAAQEAAAAEALAVVKKKKATKKKALPKILPKKKKPVIQKKKFVKPIVKKAVKKPVKKPVKKAPIKPKIQKKAPKVAKIEVKPVVVEDEPVVAAPAPIPAPVSAPAPVSNDLVGAQEQQMGQLIDPNDPNIMSKISTMEVQSVTPAPIPAPVSVVTPVKPTIQDHSSDLINSTPKEQPTVAPVVSAPSTPEPAPIAPEIPASVAPATPAPIVAAPITQNDLDAQKLALIEQIKKISSLDQLKNVMANNVLSSNTLPAEKEKASVVKKLEPKIVVPKAVSAKSSAASQRLADLESQIQQTDELIKETKTVSVEEIMGPEEDKSHKKIDKNGPKSSDHKTASNKLDAQNVMEKEDNMKVSKKQHLQKSSKLTQKSVKSPIKKDNNNGKNKNETSKGAVGTDKDGAKASNATQQKTQSTAQLSKKTKAMNYSEEIISKKDSFAQVLSVKNVSTKPKHEAKNKTSVKHPQGQKGKANASKASVKGANGKKGQKMVGDKKKKATHGGAKPKTQHKALNKTQTTNMTSNSTTNVTAVQGNSTTPALTLEQNGLNQSKSNNLTQHNASSSEQQKEKDNETVQALGAKDQNSTQIVQQAVNVTVSDASTSNSSSSKDTDNHIEFNIKLVKPAGKVQAQKLAQVEAKSYKDVSISANETSQDKVKSTVQISAKTSSKQIQQKDSNEQTNKSKSLETAAIGTNGTQAQVNASSAEAANKTADPTTLDDTISQVFDQMHQSTMEPSSGIKDEADSADQGFIGKHLKKLKEKEEQKQRKLEEERRAIEIEKYGVVMDKEAKGEVTQEMLKKRGIMARAKAKIDKELKDQQAIQIGESIGDPDFAASLQDLVQQRSADGKTDKVINDVIQQQLDQTIVETSF